MRLEGRVYRSGNKWLVEVPLLEAMTQGRTRKEALLMIVDWIRTMADDPDADIRIHQHGKNEFEVEAARAGDLIKLMLRRRREARGLSLADVAERLQAKSRNAYARYERGEAVPTIEKLDELMRAVSGGGDFVIRESSE